MEINTFLYPLLNSYVWQIYEFTIDNSKNNIIINYIIYNSNRVLVIFSIIII